MPDTVMMECGHAANATTEGNPCCAICFMLDPGATVVSVSPPSLEGRIAVCPHCKKTKPSSPELAFFEYRGPGSDNCSKCGYKAVAHSNLYPTNPVTGRANPVKDHNFDPAGKETDVFYDGCFGWD
jgi:hypothetical protein